MSVHLAGIVNQHLFHTHSGTGPTTKSDDENKDPVKLQESYVLAVRASIFLFVVLILCVSLNLRGARAENLTRKMVLDAPPAFLLELYLHQDFLHCLHRRLLHVSFLGSFDEVDKFD